MNIENHNDIAERVSNLLRVLSAKNRLLILCLLLDEERSVGELCQAVGMKAPAMSQQLGLMRREGIVRVRREGQTVFYSLADEDTRAILAYIYATFCVQPLETDLDPESSRELPRIVGAG